MTHQTDRGSRGDVHRTAAGLGRVNVVDRADELVVKPVGVVDLLTAPLLDEALRRVSTGTRKQVVVDLSGTSLLAGRGIGVIAAAGAALRSTGRSLVVTGARGAVGRALAACDMHHVDNDPRDTALPGNPPVR